MESNMTIGDNHQSPQGQMHPSEARPQPNQASFAGQKGVQEKVEQLLLFAYFAVAAVLLFRFALALFGASVQSAFVKFIYDLTTPFMLPFEGMFGAQPQVAQFRIEFEVIVALLVYALVFFGLNRLIHIIFK